MGHRMSRQTAVSLCLTAAMVACRNAKAPAIEVPPPPAVVSPRPEAEPPQPEPRETKVWPLDSQNCTPTETTLIDFTSAQVRVRCDSGSTTTRVLLTVLSRTADPGDHLQALSLRFCGDVVNAEAPAGWEIEIEREEGRSAIAADVTWKLPGAAAYSAPAAGRAISGFAVTLRRPWRRGLGYYVTFSESGGAGSSSPHDCPYPFR